MTFKYQSMTLDAPHREARDIIERDPNLDTEEIRILSACIRLRQEDRQFVAAMRVRAAQEERSADESAQDFTSYWNGGSIRAIVTRLFSGELFGSGLDVQAGSYRNEISTDFRRRRQMQFAHHNECYMRAEAAKRALLAEHGPYAKRLFNELAITRSTSQHFPTQEIAPAMHLPNPFQQIRGFYNA